jgi:hypothetical protein
VAAAGKGPKDTLTVVVGGNPVEVHANENQQLSVIIEHALKEAKQVGRPASDWELRSGAEQDAPLLDADKKLRDYGLTLSSTVWLSLGSGGGG